MSISCHQVFQSKGKCYNNAPLTRRKGGAAVLITFVTAGYPSVEATPSLLLSLQEGGADIIELGIPFTDPLADGPTIQQANQVALENQVDIDVCLDLVRKARELGVRVPIIFMGYYNPLLSYGEDKLMQKCQDVGVNGFIVVDLPPREAQDFVDICKKYQLAYIPLIAPSTSDSRIERLVKSADAFIYVVSKMGITGASKQMNADLPSVLERVRKYTNQPLAVGFGVSARDHFEQVRDAGADGVVVGSKILQVFSLLWGVDGIMRPGIDVNKAVKEFCQSIKSNEPRRDIPKSVKTAEVLNETATKMDARFGDFGGQFVPEALVDCLNELEQAFAVAKDDESFWQEFRSHYHFVGRPSPLQLAARLTEHAGGAKIWLKREDLNHTGSHKINNALGQILLAQRIGKRRIIAETGAGQHGVATATVCAKFGLECVVYMGAEDVRRQALNVFRMKLMGATVIPVTSGSQTLKDAVNEAMRDWVTNVQSTHYLVGSAIGPHPFPTLVREFQSVIGKEAREQMLQQAKALPDLVVACVGGGSNAIGTFHPFVKDPHVRLLGVEAAGEGLETGAHSATLTAGTPGVFHGARTYLLQDQKGQIRATHSISAGLDYPAVGPEHAHLKDSSRAQYVAATDLDALKGFRKMCELEGIIPALETAHAIHVVLEEAAKLRKDQHVLLCLSGRGDKDVHSVAEALPKLGPQMAWDLRFA